MSTADRIREWWERMMRARDRRRARRLRWLSRFARKVSKNARRLADAIDWPEESS